MKNYPRLKVLPRSRSPIHQVSFWTGSDAGWIKKSTAHAQHWARWLWWWVYASPHPPSPPKQNQTGVVKPPVEYRVPKPTGRAKKRWRRKLRRLQQVVPFGALYSARYWHHGKRERKEAKNTTCSWQWIRDESVKERPYFNAERIVKKEEKTNRTCVRGRKWIQKIAGCTFGQQLWDKWCHLQS